MQVKHERARRVWGVGQGPCSVLHRGKLLVSLDLEQGKLVRQLERVEDEELQLDSGDGARHGGDILARHVVHPGAFELLRHLLEEGAREKVHGHVPPVVEQLAVRADAARLLRMQLAVLHNLHRASSARKHPHALLRVRLSHNPRPTIRPLLAAVPHEQRVPQAGQSVVYAVAVHHFHPSGLHVLQAPRPGQRHVEPAVAVRGARQLGSGFHDDAAALGDARHGPLLEELHLPRLESKELVVREEALGVIVRELARHDVPWNLHLRIRLACGRRRQMLQAQQALRLKLKQRLVGWEADVVASLGSRAT
mmetsp:Transcript_10204/g.19316  ORF Transcript_10204/g.19316 Transcript_10204/m.19316 type:complete len:308 (-) Transcript_10204:117-1040(-)